MAWFEFSVILCPMGQELSEQELHYLAMNIVGNDLESKGYEFMGVNSKLKKNPQFVALKDKVLHFVVVRAISYPDPVQVYDLALMEEVKAHAEQFEAKTYYAGVGLGHGDDYTQPVIKDEPYSMVYEGMQEIP